MCIICICVVASVYSSSVFIPNYFLWIIFCISPILDLTHTYCKKIFTFSSVFIHYSFNMSLHLSLTHFFLHCIKFFSLSTWNMMLWKMKVKSIHLLICPNLISYDSNIPLKTIRQETVHRMQRFLLEEIQPNIQPRISKMKRKLHENDF